MKRRMPRVGLVTAILLVIGVLTPLAPAAAAPGATTVTIAGSLQSELGCGGDWDPGCAATELTYDAADDVWQATFDVPAGTWEYKAALDGSWDVNYGAHAQPGGDNITLTLASPTTVRFYYQDATHWVTDSVGSTIVTAAGSFQEELGCSGDWQPDCLRSWLQDPDGDGTYTLATTGIPAGSYETKAAIDEGWDENYGQDGTPGGDNIPFTVTDGQTVTFSYVAATHVLTVAATGAGTPGGSDNVQWDGLRHDSRDTLYRTPGGAVAAGTSVTLRLRTFHDDVTGVRLRLYSQRGAGQSLLAMTREATDVTCRQTGLEDQTCDYWAVTLPNKKADNLWYRFIVTDGTKTVYYADDTAALDGGLGKPSDDQVDHSWALTVHVKGFTAPAWAKDAVIYQIFPDRFGNGSTANDPRTGDVRYDDPVIATAWGSKPEGFCRNYVGATTTTCPWRYGDPTPTVADLEQPRGRDYQGGDLAGIDAKLDQLKALGISTIYLNPIFDSGSNHGYDTQDYTKVDPYFGTQKDFDNLVKHAKQRGMRLILDGVFNHLSSDSPFFDRYHHYPTVGACESATSPYRSWFTFRKPAAGETGTCAPSTPGGEDTYYDGWFGFDSIPVLDKSVAEVQKYFLTSKDSIARKWLKAGAAGWRMDVMGDASFPDGYWETFREVVKKASKDALIVSETWQKDSALMRNLRGDRADTTMNYRLRDAVLGLLAPGPFDSKGFPDSGRIISPTEFGNRVASLREDYPDAVLYSAMNLLDSHDTARLRWTLTPGQENPADKELNPTNVAAGVRATQLASLLQFAMPGAPTVYYGDEIGVTGADDPDDRRAYPWSDQGGSLGQTMQRHYTALAKLRAHTPALREGDLRVLLADDAAGTVALGRATGKDAAIVLVNRSDAAASVTVPVAGYLPDGTRLRVGFTVGGTAGSVTVTDGAVTTGVPAHGAVVLVADRVDLRGPRAPKHLTVADEGTTSVRVSWKPVGGAAGYDVLVSPVSGGGYLPVNDTPVKGRSYTIEGLAPGQPVHVVVRARDRAANLGAPSAEVVALPHYAIKSAIVDRPATLTHTISAVTPTDPVYGQVRIDGLSSQPGATPTLVAQLGYGPDRSNPARDTSWTWVDATFGADVAGSDEFQATLLPEATGSYDYAYRFTTTGGRDWVYADLDGSRNGYSSRQAGTLTVTASSDTTAPAAPTGLEVTGAGPSEVSLAWTAPGDADVARYQVERATGSGSFASVGRVDATTFVDSTVTEGATYRYRVRAIDSSLNVSSPSDVVQAVADRRQMSVTLTVTVPASTDDTGRPVNIAGTLDQLDGGHPQWDPAGTPLTRVDATTWQITLTGKENTQLHYKYALADWEHVEKEAGTCAEISDRTLTLTYGGSGQQQVADTVGNWRNVAPCGN